MDRKVHACLTRHPDGAVCRSFIVGDDFDAETQAGPVLLLTIHDAIYPINTHLIERICSYCGPVLRIVIFRKKCVQAMVEMDSILAAQRVKAAINGCDIYKHCCTVKGRDIWTVRIGPNSQG